MNSCDERIEKSLNRAGQTISDLPEGYLLNAGEAKAIQGVACRWFVDEDAPEGVALRNLVSIPLYQYILHLTDVVDRMETALENVCGERDYLRTMARKEGCRTCIHHTYDNHLLCENEGKLCSLDDRGNCENYEYEGVPENWSVQQ